MTLNLTTTSFAAGVAQLAEGLLGESAGPVRGDGCPRGDRHCYAGFVGDHRLCQYRLAPCSDPTDGCPKAARQVAAGDPGDIDQSDPAGTPGRDKKCDTPDAEA